MSKRQKLLQMMRQRTQSMKPKTPDLIKVLQSEITHELNNPPFQNDQSSPPGDFKVEWDAPHAEDIFLRKKCESGEEVAVSALLGYELDNPLSKTYPREVLTKVLIKKPGLASLLQFDCNICMRNDSPSECDCYITSARYVQSSHSTGLKHYTGPPFSDLDPDLQTEFHEYLKARLGGSLGKFLIQHLHRKEQNQYVNWLQKLQEAVSHGESSSHKVQEAVSQGESSSQKVQEAVSQGESSSPSST